MLRGQPLVLPPWIGVLDEIIALLAGPRLAVQMNDQTGERSKVVAVAVGRWKFLAVAGLAASAGGFSAAE